MTVIKRQRRDNFAVVPNEVANDARLSFEARGLLVYLLAKPNDWRVTIPDLMKQGQIGRDKAYKLLNELIGAGYVDRDREQDPETGRVLGFNYTIYDVAVQTTLPLPEKPGVVEPLPDLPDTAQPDTENQDTYKEQRNTNTPQPPSGGLDLASLWESWSEDARGNPENVASAFNRLTAIEKSSALRTAEIALSAYRRRKTRIPALVRYLRERLFNEFDGGPEIDLDGQFVIKPDRPEWSAWLGWVRKSHGQRGVDHSVKVGKIIVDTRWPPGHEKAA